MEESVGKRGLSPVIASVLLILLVLVLAVIIFLWARGFISEQIEKFGQPIEESCRAVKFDVARFGSELEIVNIGDIDIRYLDIKMFDNKGNSEVARFPLKIDAGESVRDYVTLEMADGSVPDKIIAYPALVGKTQGTATNNIFTCMDSGVTL